MQLARRLHLLRIVALLGSILSLLLLYNYYTGQDSLCSLGDYFVCTFSETSYATLDGLYQFLSVGLGNTLPTDSLGIPNSLIFLLGFLALLLFTYKFKADYVFGFKVTFYILAAYTVFLTYVETYRLYTLCLFCFVLTLLVFLSLWLLIGLHVSISAVRRKRR